MYTLLAAISAIPFVYASNGNVQSTINAQTNVSGNGTTETHIEQTVNGKTTVIDSNSPGSIHVVTTDNGTTVTTGTPAPINFHVRISPVPTIKAIPTIQPVTTTSATIKHPPIGSVFTVIHNIWDWIRSVFSH